MFTALWALVWAGEVTNDLWLPLRAPRRLPALTRPSAGGLRRRRAGGARGAPSAVAGRWSLAERLFRDAPAADERRRILAELLVERHGVLTRSAALSEGVPGGYAAVYPALTDLETLGAVRRGYFVAGLGGAQFAMPGAVERLRDLRDAPADGDPHMLVLGAADPAQPYGAAAPWPERRGRRPLAVARRSGPRWSLVDGAPALYLERGGRGLLTFDGLEDGAAGARGAGPGGMGPGRPPPQGGYRAGRRRAGVRVAPRAAPRRRRLPHRPARDGPPGLSR